MIFEALAAIAETMNDFLRMKLRTVDNKVIVSGLVNQSGSMAAAAENKIILTLVYVDRETVTGVVPVAAQRATQPAARSLSLNLHVLFSAYFSDSNYPEALKFLSLVISYLNLNNVLTPEQTPRLPAEIDRLVLELMPLGLERMNNLWATLGAKHMPSVLYRVRMITFPGDESPYVPVITGTDRSTHAIPQ